MDNGFICRDQPQRAVVRRAAGSGDVLRLVSDIAALRQTSGAKTWLAKQNGVRAPRISLRMFATDARTP